MSVGLDRLDYFVVIAGCIVVAVVGIIKEKSCLERKESGNCGFRSGGRLYYALIFAVLILGAYGMGYQQVDMDLCRILNISKKIISKNILLAMILVLLLVGVSERIVNLMVANDSYVLGSK